jgi:hypothetical protein
LEQSSDSEEVGKDEGSELSTGTQHNTSDAEKKTEVVEECEDLMGVN